MYIINYISLFSILFPLLIICFTYKQLTREIPSIILYIFSGIIFEIINYVTITICKNDTIISSNIFTLLEAILILLALNQWSLNDKNRFIFIGLLSIYIFVWCYSISLNGINKLSTLINGTEALVIIAASIYFLHNYFISENVSNAKWQTTFSIAFLFYFLVNSGIYSFTELLLNIELPQNWIYFSWIHLIGNFGLNTILGIGIYQCSKQSSMV